MKTEKRNGIWIVLEAIDNGGKGEVQEGLERWLQKDLNVETVFSREPNDDTPMGKLIRKVLQHEESIKSIRDFQTLFI